MGKLQSFMAQPHLAVAVAAWPATSMMAFLAHGFSDGS